LFSAAKLWMPGIADKFTPSAQAVMAGHDELTTKCSLNWLRFRPSSQV
jgi:hypothetical protein